MLNTLAERKKFVADIIELLNSKFDLSDTQIFVFGSFLTDDFIPEKSDIDIGVYSENETKMYDIQYELSKYLTEVGINFDIVIMTLSQKLLINIPIMVHGTSFTNYDNTKLLPYLKSMIDKYGFIEKGLSVSSYE